MPKGTLANWVAAIRGKVGETPAGSQTVAELEQENARLRKELAEARLERDILKKATAYFARESLPGTRS
jgi:transposase